MELRFSKWHGTGNDFLLIDDRDGSFPDDTALVQRLCDRHFGIGSDGLILIQAPRSEGVHFHMEFFNPDASKSFCGNGSRCAFAFWSVLKGSEKDARFTAIDGEHVGQWIGKEVAITLPNVGAVDHAMDGADVDLIHTGSPHELVWVADTEGVDIMIEGPKRRHAPRHAPGGTNVNFVQLLGDGIRMRTFERGVEAETLSCGSGVVAAGLSAMLRHRMPGPLVVKTRGGILQVEATMNDRGGFEGIRLIGPVQHVFNGIVSI
jgi:diaminopimelate epimerase